MPDRRRIVDQAIMAAGAYLHPNFCVGEQDKKLHAIGAGGPITSFGANFLVGWMWSKHPALAGALENAIFDALDDTTAA
jgi:hypothetical protein